jgi:chromosome segregation ATPase
MEDKDYETALREVASRHLRDPSKDHFTHAVDLLAAYRRAKTENDERFMLERDDARAERDVALSIVARGIETQHVLENERDELRKKLDATCNLVERNFTEIGELEDTNEKLRQRLSERVTLHEKHIAEIAEVRTQLKATILLSDALHDIAEHRGEEIGELEDYNEKQRHCLSERMTLHEKHIAEIAEVRTQLKATILLSDALHSERDDLKAKLAEARAQATLAWDKYDVAQTDWRLRVIEVAAERDKLAAELAAYQGRPEGALNEHWAWGDEQIGEGWIRRLDEKIVLFADHSDWRVWRYTGVSDLLDVNEWGNDGSFLGNMRAAEAAARKLGWLAKETS